MIYSILIEEQRSLIKVKKLIGQSDLWAFFYEKEGRYEVIQKKN